MKARSKFLVTSALACLGVSAVAVCANFANTSNNLNSDFLVPTRKNVDMKPSYLINDGDAEYIDFMTGFIGGNAGLARFRNDTFWVEKMRFFGMDYFCDTSLAAGGEGWTGSFTSREFAQRGNPYVCFQMGGDSQKNRNKCEIQVKVDDDWFTINTVYNDYFADPLSCQQLIFRVVEIDSQYRNSTLRAVFTDNSTGGFGMLTFGAFTGACSLDSAAKLYNLYNLALTDALLPGSTGNTTDINNKKAADHIRNDILTNGEYAAVRTRAAAIGEVNNISDDFETVEGYPTFTEDYLFSDNGGENHDRFNIFSNSYRTNLKVAEWASNMPFNQTNDYFLSSSMNERGEATAEGVKGRFFSSPFVLRGSGYISVKMAGASAQFSVWDADTYEILFSVVDDGDSNSRIFNDHGWSVYNTCVDGSRLGTMTRVYVDCTQYLGRKLFVSLEDYRTGGAWGLARFDEFVSYYPETPNIGYDDISQTYDNVTGYGVCRDILVNGQDNDFTSAWNFLENTYFPTARAYSNDNAATFCVGPNTYNSSIKSTLESAYNVLSPQAKAIVDVAKDYQYSGYGSSDAMYTTSLITGLTVGEALTYMGIK